MKRTRRVLGTLAAMLHNLVRPSHRIATVCYENSSDVVIFCWECREIFYDGDGRILAARREHPNKG